MSIQSLVMKALLIVLPAHRVLTASGAIVLAFVFLWETHHGRAAVPEPSNTISAFLERNVLGRKMVTAQSEPQRQDPASGKSFHRSFTRTSWYSNACKTDFGLTVQYNVDISWKTFYLDDQGKPTGEPFDLTSYSTKFEFSLAQYPGHESLHGILRAVEIKREGKPVAIGPEHYGRVVAYLTNDAKRRDVLRLEVEYLFPGVVKAGIGEKTRLGTGQFFEGLWLDGGRLHRSQLWLDYHVDHQTLQRTRPITEERELYLESE